MMQCQLTMWQSLKKVLSQKTTRMGILAALMFQLIFGLVWMTGYEEVTDNVQNLKVIVLNGNPQIEQKIVANLRTSLPVTVESLENKGAAFERLENREAHMVLEIPSDFAEKLQTPGEQATLRYTLNEANPAMVKSVMTGIIAKITEQVNKEAVGTSVQAALTQVKVPAPQAQGMAAALSERVVADVQTVNPVSSFAHQMVPMMIVLASFVGSMVMGMMVNQSMEALRGTVCKWKRLASWSLINVVAAVLVGLFGASVVVLLGDLSVDFLALWGFQILSLLTFMFVSMVFVLLLGQPGMVFNIILLSVQLVTSGTMVPRAMLSEFYNGLSKFLPATYVAEGSVNLLFTEGSIASPALNLVWILLVAAVLAVLAVAVRRDTAANAVSQEAQTQA